MKQVLHRPEATWRLVKWAVELTQFDILYQSRTAVKGQALADFIAEFIFPSKEDWDREIVRSKIFTYIINSNMAFQYAFYKLFSCKYIIVKIFREVCRNEVLKRDV